MRDIFTVAQDLSLRELFSAILYALPRTKIIRQLFIFITCIGLLAGLMGLLAPGENEKTSIKTFLTFLIAPVSLLTFVFVFSLLISIFIVRFKPHTIRGITFRFTHWGMVRTGEGIRVAIPWRDFQAIKDTKSFFMLDVIENNVQNIHAIQKRMFASAEEAEKFREFVECHLPV
jgi:hypothetical protein